MGESSTISYLCISFETRSAISSECVIELVSEADSAHGDKNGICILQGGEKFKLKVIGWAG